MALAALTLETSVKYVAAAYGVVLVVLVAYVAILRAKLTRMEGELAAAETRLAELDLERGTAA